MQYPIHMNPVVRQAADEELGDCKQVHTQEKFAKRINKTTGFISSVETGRSGLSSDTIQEICSAFGINEAWLRDGTGEMGANKASADINGIGERVKPIVSAVSSCHKTLT